MERITAPDGAGIVVHSRGVGPGVVVVHGGGVTIQEYRRLSARLADRCTVHLFNRRGRGGAAPKREPYRVEQDVDDLGAVLEHTGARHVIGHSVGGFIALRAALRLPIDRLVLYDAAVSIDGGFPAGYLDATEAALRAGDTARAMAIVGAGLNTRSVVSRLPLGVRTAICRAFLLTPIGRRMGELLPTTLLESRQVLEHDGPAGRYAGVRAEVLLACGADGPPYYPELGRALAAVLPSARTLEIPRSGHDAVARAHARVVDPIAAFLTAPVLC
jgi:pimeloyl-ACP methyl ester carboxylesterase